MIGGVGVSIMTIRYLNQLYRLAGYMITIPEFLTGWLGGGGGALSDGGVLIMSWKLSSVAGSLGM